jgi:hypothetical protein
MMMMGEKRRSGWDLMRWIWRSTRANCLLGSAKMKNV